MIRAVFAIAGVVLCVSVAIAQQDPIAVRKSLMKANGDAAKAGAAMAKGDQPFDLATAHKIFAAFEDAAAKMPMLFPPNSKTGETAARAEIWENMDDLKVRFEKFGADARAADESVKDLD